MINKENITKIIRDALSNISGITFINTEDSGEGVLFGFEINFVDTLSLNQVEYNKWEDMCADIDITNNPNFQIYCSFDSSSYDYWTNIMQENNTTYLDVWCSDNFSNNDVPNLVTEITTIIDDFNTFLKNLPKKFAN